MSEKSIGKNDFLSGPILPPLIQFALPLMLSLLLQAALTWRWWGAVPPRPACPRWPPAAR